METHEVEGEPAKKGVHEGKGHHHILVDIDLMEHHMAKYQRRQKQPSEPTNLFRRNVKQFPPALGPTILHNCGNGHHEDDRNNDKSRAIEVVHVRCQPL